MPGSKIVAAATITLAISALLDASLAGPVPPAAASACGDPITLVGLYVSPLKGEENLGRRIASIVSMQILTTLRPLDPAIPGSNFGHGLVETITPQAPLCSDLLLSGEVKPLGEGALLQASLTRLPQNDRRRIRPEVWTVAFMGKSVSLDAMKPSYVFAPVEIRKEVLSRYSRLRDIRFCLQPKLPCGNGVLGYANVYAQDTKGEFEQVVLTDGRKGWLYLPAIADRSEVVDFAAAVIRLERGDYDGADALFDNVQRSKATTGNRVDALVLQLVARELAGRDGRDLLEVAKKLNPSLRSLFQVKTMMDFQGMVRSKDENVRDGLIESAAETLETSRELFEPSDSWFVAASEFVRVYRDAKASGGSATGGCCKVP